MIVLFVRRRKQIVDEEAKSSISNIMKELGWQPPRKKLEERK